MHTTVRHSSRLIRMLAPCQPRFAPPSSPLFNTRRHFIPRAPFKLWPVEPTRTVPSHIPAPPYAADPKDETLRATDSTNLNEHGVQIKTAEQIKAMRKACEFTSQIRSYAGSLCVAGRTTEELDRMVHEMVISHDIYPSPIGYAGFPKACCTSLNQVICHGIPDTRPLEDGDILNIDVSTYVDGHHGDCSGMFVVGQADPAALRLIKVTEECVERALALCGPGVPFKSIGHTIHEHADANGFDTVRAFCGHGIGRDFHMAPHVLFYRNNQPEIMEPGMVFTIEPMLCEGKEAWEILDDGWTIVTRDGLRSAQHEDTILITEKGAEVLTAHSEWTLDQRLT